MRVKPESMWRQSGKRLVSNAAFYRPEVWRTARAAMFCQHRTGAWKRRHPRHSAHARCCAICSMQRYALNRLEKEAQND